MVKKTNDYMWDWRPNGYEVGNLHSGLPEAQYRYFGSLPDLERDESEIAYMYTVCALGDCLSVRAKLTEDGYVYSAINDNWDEFELKIKHSKKPLTFKELTEICLGLFTADEEDLYEVEWESDLDSAPSLEELENRTSWHSDIYPEVELWFIEKFESWKHKKTPA